MSRIRVNGVSMGSVTRDSNSSPPSASVSSPSVDELRSQVEYLHITGLNTQQISKELGLSKTTIEWLSSNTSASDIEKPPETGSTAPDNQEQECLNCGRKIDTTKESPIGSAIEWFLGLLFSLYWRLTNFIDFDHGAVRMKVVKEDGAGTAPKLCNCGLPIFSNPNNLKETNDLFWIAKESFEPNHWSNIESRGLFHRTVEEYAFRIVNDVQRLDTTVQFKIIGSKIFVQQDGRNVVSEKHDRLARIVLTNEHGVQHEYWISVSLTGRTSVETKKPTGFTERRSWILTR